MRILIGSSPVYNTVKKASYLTKEVIQREINNGYSTIYKIN